MVFTAVLTVSVAACGPVAEPEDAAAPLAPGSFTATLNGFEIHYEVHGTGPVMMAVPNSWGLSLGGLRGLLGGLERHFTMVYLDPRGMGASAPEREPSDRGPEAVRADFDALRRHLGLERIHAIGWSNGAANLMLLAAEHPHLFETAVFLHGNARLRPEDRERMVAEYADLMRAFGEFGREMQSAELSDTERDARVKRFDLDVWFPYMFADREAAPGLLSEAFEPAEFSWDHAAYTQQVWADFDARDRLGEIRARSLVIAGTHDILPPDSAREVADGIADAEFVVFERSGHFAPLEEPGRFVDTVVRFVTGKP